MTCSCPLDRVDKGKSLAHSMLLINNPYSFYKKWIACRSKVLVTALLIWSLFSYIGLFIWIFFYSPDDLIQGNLVKIMYIHVPSAWTSMIAYVALGVAAIGFLSYKNPFFDAISYTSNIITLHATTLALITGSIWGKAAWGTWWAWDARLTSMLIQWVILLICLLLRNNNRGNQASCVFAIVGLINIPIIKFSVSAWTTLHQTSSIMSKEGIAIDSSMLYPLLFSFFTLIVFYHAIGLLILERELNKIRNSRRNTILL